jgi:uncharacterized surface protein with fasciclin (FAS1) repeats
MTYGRSLLRAAMVAAPLSALGFGAQAADVISTIQNQQQFSTLAKAMKAAGIGTSLEGSGPYTIFAPTDQAFAQLPPGTMDYLMQPGNQDQLKKLLQYHVVKGNELQADQMIGKQTKVDTVEGGKLSLDGTGRMVLLVPAGLTVNRAGDQAVAHDGAAKSAPAVGDAAAGGDQQAQTDVTQQGNMPATKHQEEVLRQHPKTEQQQTMAQTEGAMPSTKHQREVLRGQQPGEQQNGQPMAARESGERQGALRQATVVGGPIKAGNGVIYAIDAVLVPQSILSQIENQGQQGRKQQNKG